MMLAMYYYTLNVITFSIKKSTNLSPRKLGMPPFLDILSIISLAILAPLLVLTQKLLFVAHFEWPFFMAALDFLLLFIALEVIFFKKKNIILKLNIKAALFFSTINYASTIFWFISIQQNSVCLCQLSQLSVNFLIAIGNFIYFRKSYPMIVFPISFLLLLIGSSIAISNDPQFTFNDFRYPLLYLVSTSVASFLNQIYQYKHKISNSLEFYRSFAFFEIIISFFLVGYIERYRNKTLNMKQFSIYFYDKVILLILIPLTFCEKMAKFRVGGLPHHSMVISEFIGNVCIFVFGSCLFPPVEAELQTSFLKRLLGYIIALTGNVLISSFSFEEQLTNQIIDDQIDLVLDQKFLPVL